MGSYPTGLTLLLGSEVNVLHPYVCVRLNRVTVFSQLYYLMVDCLEFLSVLVVFD